MQILCNKIHREAFFLQFLRSRDQESNVVIQYRKSMIRVGVFFSSDEWCHGVRGGVAPEHWIKNFDYRDEGVQPPSYSTSEASELACKRGRSPLE